MAKKDKNSLLNIHYSRTMTSDNLSKAANYVGNYVLKGLGAFGKIATAPFRSQGPTSATIYKSKELLAKERTIENKSEELLGKAMTWVSPLNYGTALATGNGLNARKGEEEVASWSPAWQAVGRLGELYVGPKVVKGVKAAPKVVVNTAAKVGVKPAKAAVVAREINLATKNKPKYTRVPSKNLFRTQVYKGGEITDPYSNFVTTDPLYAANYGKVTPYIFESKSIAKAKEPMMGSSDPVNMDMFIYHNTKGNPNATAIIGHDAVTGEFTPSKGVEILNMNPKNLYPIRTSDSPTSLKFFERNPSKISEAERLGIPKGDRGNLSLNLKLAIEDLALYKNSGLYRQVFRVTPDWEDFGWNLDRNNPTFMLLFIADKETMKGPFARVLLLTPTGKGVVAWNPEKNMGGYSSRSFTTPEGMNWAPGEANMMLDGANGLKVILTAPKTDFFDSVVEESSKHLGENLSSTIDKNIMKDFWINSRKVQRPGSYMSGDNGVAPLGSTLIEAFKKKQLYKTPLLERPINLLFIRRTGLSPDSYSSIIRLGNRDGSLRWGEGFTKWNNSAVENKFINDAFEQLKKGEISPEQYEGIFNKWSLKIGGRPLQWTTIGELKIPVHPHPYIYAKKQGGKMNILEFLKKGSGIHIKEENKGKFTSYCGGKVTDECILKGKNSSNPAIRKRAIFAANARKWKHEDGGLLELLPIYGTYKDFERFKENPNWRTGASLGLSALGDLALFTGAGAIVKGLTTANKARRAYRAANSAANLARQKVWNAGSKLNRETLAVNSLTLMNAPTKTIMLRLASKNLAKQNYTAALNEDNKAFNALLKAGKNPNINFRGSDYIPFMVTNPSFHAASVAIKKNGGILKAQYGAPLNLSTEDIQGGLNYITQGLGKVWNIMNAPVVNVQPSTTAYLPNGSLIEIPGTQTGVVDDSFGKGGGGKKVGKKLLQSVAKSKDKGLTVTKKVDNSVRHGLVNVDQDLRHFGGGNRRMDPEELIQEMDKHVEFKEFAKRLSKRFSNLKKDNPQSVKDFKALKNKYEDMFNDFLHNGIKKHLEGAKLTFGLKLGNFANSDLGKSVISNGLSFLSDKLFNKSASSNLEIALAAQEKELPTIDPIQVAQMIEIARNQYADPENPNANGGDIFNSYIKNQITAPILARQLEEHKKRLAAIDLLKNQAKSSAVGTFFNTLAQGGIEYLLNKYGTTEKADS